MSSSATAGSARPFISETRCDRTKSTCSSTRASQVNSASCRSSTARTTKTLFLPFSPQVSAAVATASAKTNRAKSSPSPRKTCSNTAPTAPMLSILSTSVARSSRITIPFRCQCRVFCDPVDKLFNIYAHCLTKNLYLCTLTAKSENDRLTKRKHSAS